jgi:hypothetical protein
MAKGLFLGFLFATCVGLLVLAVLHHRTGKISREDSPPATGEDTESAPTKPAGASPAPRPRAPVVDHPNDQRSPAPEGAESAAAAHARTQADIVRDLENAFRTDQPPNGRSAQTTAAIVAAFGEQRAAGAHLNAVDCRATRCKLDIDFANGETSNRVLQDLFGMLASHGVENVGDLGFYVSSRDNLPNGAVNTGVHLFPVERTPNAE